MSGPRRKSTIPSGYLPGGIGIPRPSRKKTEFKPLPPTKIQVPRSSNIGQGVENYIWKSHVACQTVKDTYKE